MNYKESLLSERIKINWPVVKLPTDQSRIETTCFSFSRFYNNQHISEVISALKHQRQEDTPVLYHLHTYITRLV